MAPASPWPTADNNRVLIWNTFPTTNGQAADVVLGPAGLHLPDRRPTTSSRMSSPTGVSSTGKQLFVADTSNSRVLVWNTCPTANGQPADVVLGQPDFTSRNRGRPQLRDAPQRPQPLPAHGVSLATPYVVVTDYRQQPGPRLREPVSPGAGWASNLTHL